MSTQASAAPLRSWLPTYITLGIVWGSSFLFIEKTLTFLTPVGIAFLRCLLGALTLWVVVIAKRSPLIKEPLVIFHLWIVSLLLNVFPGVLFAFAQERTSSILAGIMNALTPLMSLLMILLIFKGEKITRNRTLGIALGFIGVLVVLLVGNAVGSFSLIAFFALLLAVIGYGVAFPYTSKFLTPRQLAPEALATTQVSLGAITLLPFFIYHGINSYQPSIVGVGSILALGILSTGIAYIWNFKNVALAGASLASTVTYITPLVAVILGVALLGEPLTWNEPVGGLIVLIGSAIAQGRIRVFKE